MNVLILGGTSFFGRALAVRLIDEGHKVTVCSRGNRPAPPGASHVKGDRLSAEDLKRVASAATWDAVVDNIGMNEADARCAVDALAGNARRIVFTSTISVYSCLKGLSQPCREEDTDDLPLDEELRSKVDTDPGAAYCFGKRAAELCYRQAHRDRLVDLAIVRPGLVLGPNDASFRAGAYWERLLDGDPMPLPDGGLSAWQFAYSDDVAALLRLAIESSQASGQVFNAVNREIVSLREFLDRSAEILGVTPTFESIPSEWLQEQGFDWSGSPLAGDSIMLADISRAMTLLRWQPTPMRIWLPKTLRWFVDHGRRPDDPRMSSRKAEIDLLEGWRTLLQGPDVSVVT